MVKTIFESSDGTIFRFTEVKLINSAFKTVHIAGHTIVFSEKNKNDFKRFIKEFKAFVDLCSEFEVVQAQEAIEHRKLIAKFEVQEIRGK